MVNRYEHLYQKMIPILVSKRDELHLYGYSTVTLEDIWAYCIDRMWRREKIEEIPLHKMVNDLMKISPAAYMTHTQIVAQREADWFSEVNTEELQMLLGTSNKNNQ